MWLHSINHREWPGVSFFLNVFVINRVVLPVGDFISARKKAFVSYFLQKVPAWQRSARYNVCSLVWLYIYGPYLGKTRVLALCSGSQTLPLQVGPFLSAVHWVVFDMWSVFCTKACGYRAGEHSLQQESRVLMGRSLFVVLTFSLSIHLTRFRITGFRSPWATLYQHWPLSQVTGPMVRLSISHSWLYPTQAPFPLLITMQTPFRSDRCFSNVRPKDIRIFVRRVYRYGSMIQCTGKQVKLVNSCKLTCSPTARSLWSPDRSNEHKLLVKESLGC